MRALANDFKNFIRIDDDEKEYDVTFIEGKAEDVLEQPEKKLTEPTTNPTRMPDHYTTLEEMISRFESLPQNVMTMPITHYEFYSFLVLFREMLKS